MSTINLNVPVSSVLKLGTPRENERIASLLNKENITTVGELCSIPSSVLRKIPSIGDESIRKILKELDKYSLSLGMSKQELDGYADLHQHSNQKSVMLDDETLGGLKQVISQTKELGDYLLGRRSSPDNQEDEGKDNVEFGLPIHVCVDHPAQRVSWNDRFFEVAKEEFLRSDREFFSDETRALRAVLAAEAFMDAFLGRCQPCPTNE
jgi:hypothetical protein